MVADAQAKLDAGITEKNSAMIKTGNEILKIASAKLRNTSQATDATRIRLTEEYDKKQKTFQKLSKFLKD